MKKSIFDLEFQNADMSSKISAGLERLSEAYRVLLWEHAKVIGLSPIQIQILIFVAFHDESLCNVSQLAQEFNVTKPTISDAVRVLNKKGLIAKITSPTDKRAYSIALSKEGNAMVKKTQHFAQPIHTLFDQIEQKEQGMASKHCQTVHQRNQTKHQRRHSSQSGTQSTRCSTLDIVLTDVALQSSH